MPAVLARSLAVALLAAAPAAAQNGLLDPGPAAAGGSEARPEYSQTIGRLTPTEIIQQKAQAKAAQRQSRIAAREWYGYSQARPTTNAVPFTGMYGPQFQGRAFARPAAHYVQRPILILSR